MLTRVSASFINLRPAEVDSAIDSAMRSIVEALDVDRCTVLRLEPDGRSFIRANAYSRPHLNAPPLNVRVFDFPWCTQMVNRGETIVFASPDDLPPEAAIDRASFERAGGLSMVLVPLEVGGKIYGTLNFLRKDRPLRWTSEELARMRLVAELFGNTIARRHVQEELEQMLGFEQMLAELAASLVSLPGDGDAHDQDVDNAIASGLRRIAEFLQVERAVLWDLQPHTASPVASHAWSRTAAGRPAIAPGPALTVLGQRLRTGAVLRIGKGSKIAEAEASERAALDSLGLGSLIALPLKVAGRVVAAVSLDDPDAHREWPDALLPRLRVLGEVFATALARQKAEQRAREARADAAQHRERLAHVSRLYTVGEMSAGIAHEINQPLVAIENYALAAHRHASADPANLPKVYELLDKIAAQSRRAGDVIGKLRAMVSRHEVEMKPICIGQIVRDSLRFAEMEGHVSEIAVTLGLRDESCKVFADEIQIQQVIVNLVRNALDAMSEQVDGRVRALHIESGLKDDARVFVRVADTGPGFAEGELRRIFEPFFSTKQKGLGIGLALCRTIIEAHGGGVSARHRPEGGAIVEFTLPIAEDM